MLKLLFIVLLAIPTAFLWGFFSAGGRDLGRWITGRIRIVDAQLLRVGPEEVLVIKIDEPVTGPQGDVFAAAICDHLVTVGLAGRSLVINQSGQTVELAAISREEVPR